MYNVIKTFLEVFVNKNILTRLKKHIYKLIEKDESGDFWSFSFDILIITMAFLNVFIIVVESFFDSPADAEVNRFLSTTLVALDYLVVSTFTIEYFLRLLVSDIIYQGISKSKALLKTILSPISLIELVALLPFFIELFGTDITLEGSQSMRFLLLLKIGKYFPSFTLIGDVLKKKKSILTAVIAIMLIVVVSASVFMYYIESSAQPEAFPNIPATLWWGVVTLTTVGYGDVYPITVAGRVLSSVVSVAGVGIVALPTGIISSGFLEELELRSFDDDEIFKKGAKAIANMKENEEYELFVCRNCGSEMQQIKKGER